MNDRIWFRWIGLQADVFANSIAFDQRRQLHIGCVVTWLFVVALVVTICFSTFTRFSSSIFFFLMYPSQETTHWFIFQPAWPIYKEFEKKIAYTNACDIYSCTLAVTLAMAWGWLLQGSPTPPSKLHRFPPWKSYNETYKGLKLHTPLRRFHMNPVVMGHVDVLLHVVTYHQRF